MRTRLDQWSQPNRALCITNQKVVIYHKIWQGYQPARCNRSVKTMKTALTLSQIML